MKTYRHYLGLKSEGQDDYCLIICIFLFTLWQIAGIQQFGILRYAVYFIPIVIMLYALNTDRRFPDLNKKFIILLLYIVVLMLMPFGKASYSSLTLRDALIIISYLIIYILAPSAKLIHFKYLLYSTLAIFIYLFFSFGSRFQFAFLTSASIGGSYDGQESFLALIYIFIFMQRGKKLEALAAIALCILAGKRIAAIGSCAGLFFILLVYPFRDRSKIIFLCVISVISVIGICFALVVETAFNSLSSLQGYNIEEFMAGRYAMGLALSKNLVGQEFLTWIFGSSAGAADNFIISLDLGITNAHDDWLKILYDYGLAGYLIYLSIFFLIFRKNIWTMGLGVATSVVMVTDNVLIYLFFQFPLFLAVRALGERSGEDLTRKLSMNAQSPARLAG